MFVTTLQIEQHHVLEVSLLEISACYLFADRMNMSYKLHIVLAFE